MAVIGNRAATNYQTIRKQTITGTGATSYSLDYSVSSPNDLEVFVNNVRQEPTTAYTASGQTITFTVAVNSTDSVYIIYQGQTVGSVVHPSDQPLGATTGTFSGAVSATTGTFTGTIAQSKAMTTQYDGIGVRMGSSTANTNRGATFLQHTYVDAGGNQGNYVYNHSLRQNDGTYIANVYTADYSVGVHSWYNPNGGLSGNPVMQIDPAGRVTMPYQPCMSGYASTTLGSTGGTSYNIVIVSSPIVNRGSHYNTSTGQFTCPVAGVYRITYFGMGQSALGDGVFNSVYGYPYKNGSGSGALAYNYGDGYRHISGNWLISCAANDVIDMRVNDAYSGYNGLTIELIG